MQSLIYNKGIFCLVALPCCLVVLVTNAIAQGGCTDPAANNYDAGATVNNGSCTYNTTTYFPPVKVAQLPDPALNENSGLQYAGGDLWTFNDSGGEPAIYRIDTTSGAILQKVLLQGASNVDWEDIAFDGANIYLGDFGNNETGARNNLRIYKFPLSAIPPVISNAEVTLVANLISIIDFSYNDQPKPLQATSGAGVAYDCEAMIVDDGKIHLFTKNWTNNTSSHYIISNTDGGVHVAQFKETINTGYLVTGADKMPNQDAIVLLGYMGALPFTHYMHVVYGYSNGFYFNGNKRRIDLPNFLEMGQAEGIAFREGAYGYISNEKVVSIPARLRSFNISSFLPPGTLALELEAFNITPVESKYKAFWRFASPVNNLELKSGDKVRSLTHITSLPSSLTGDIMITPGTGKQYFQLVWISAAGIRKQSGILSVTDQLTSDIHHIHLARNGLFSFTVSGGTMRNATLLFTTADGKRIGSISLAKYGLGTHKITLPFNVPLPNLVCVSYADGREKQTRLLAVQ
jgi:hypothetical protein